MKFWSEQAFDFVGDDGDAFFDGLGALGVGHAEAFMGVLPGLLEAGEEIVSGDDEDAAFFEALVEFFVGNGQVFEPEPEEEGAFGLVDAVIEALEFALPDRDGVLAFFQVEGFDDFTAELEDFAGFDQAVGDGGAHATGGQAEHGVEFADGLDNLFPGDNDTGTGAGQAEFGQAHTDDGIGGPDGLGVGEDNVGEWGAVGIVEDERDVFISGHPDQAGNFVIRQHIAGGIGWARQTDGADIVTNFECVEVDAVFEESVIEQFNFGLEAAEDIATDADIGVADVFGGEGQEDFFLAAETIFAGKHVHQNKKGRLAASGEGDIFGGDIPAELGAKQGAEVFDKGSIALGGVVNAKGFFVAVAIVEQVAHAGAKDLLDGRYESRIATAEHEHITVDIHGMIEVVHEEADA